MSLIVSWVTPFSTSSSPITDETIDVHVLFGDDTAALEESNVDVNNGSVESLTNTNGDGSFWKITVSPYQDIIDVLSITINESAITSTTETEDAKLTSPDIYIDSNTYLNLNIVDENPGTKIDDFSLRAVFECDVSNFNEHDITIDDEYVTFNITSSESMNYNYIIDFNLPSESTGIINIQASINAQVTCETGKAYITSNILTIEYDTITYVSLQQQSTSINVQESDLIYSENFVTFPLEFGTSITGLSKTHFNLEHISGQDIIDDIKYYLNGTGNSYNLVFELPLNNTGSFSVNLISDATISSGTGDPKSITGFVSKTINYNTIIPYISDFDMPKSITDSFLDVFIEFNVFVLNLYAGGFLKEGLELDGPTIFRASPTETTLNKGNYKSFNSWIQLTSNEAASGNSIKSKYFRLRFTVPSNVSEGVFNLSLKPNTVRTSLEIE